MTTLTHAMREALRGMRSRMLVQVVAVGAIAMGLLVLGLAAVLAINVDRLTSGWGRGSQLTVYLQPQIPATRVDAIDRLLRSRPEVASAQRVSPREAHARLARSLGSEGTLLDEIDADFLPASIEVRLRPNASPASVRPLIALLASARGVAEVDYLGRWAERLGTMLALLRRGGLIIALIVALACIYIVSSTIRLCVDARRSEIEIQRLVGASRRFIQSPFLIEGVLQGILGALLATGVLFALFRAVAPELEDVMASLLSRVELSFLGPAQLLAGICAAGVLGLLGSSLALSRHAEA